MGWQAIYAAFAQIGTTIIDSSGLFVYAGSPGPGNLIVSMAGAAGTDAFGNAFPEGLNVTMGAISGTSISGSTFNGSDFILNANGLWIYSGPPAAGNLVIALVNPGGTATDPFGNTAPFGYSSQYPIYLGPYASTPVSVPGTSILYSAGGGFQYVDGFDAQTYQTGRRTLWKSSPQTINTTGPSAFHQTTIGALAGGTGRSYLIEGRAWFTPNQSAGQMGIEWNAAGFAPNPTGLINFIWGTGPTLNAVTPTGLAVVNNPGFTMAAGVTYQIVYGGVVSIAAGQSGTLSISALTNNVADTFVVNTGSYVSVGPI